MKMHQQRERMLTAALRGLPSCLLGAVSVFSVLFSCTTAEVVGVAPAAEPCEFGWTPKGERCHTSFGGRCESGWTPIGLSCYKLTSQLETWSEAKETCRSMDSRMAEIHNAGDQRSLNYFLWPQATEVAEAWIGLTEVTAGRHWMWSSGQPMWYSSWYNNEPNNRGGNEHCVTVWPRRSSRWNDNNCTQFFRGVCQKEGSCELGWKSTGNSCFKLTAKLTTWSKAQEDCRSMSSHLAEIHNAGEQEALNNFLSPQATEVAEAWIGLNEATTGRHWIWNSGQPMWYSSWYDNEPNNRGGNEHCVTVWPKRSSRWNDNNCTQFFRAVCQKASSYVIRLPPIRGGI